MYPDVVIIGGGIIGCSCAYYLSREGVKVHLVERRSLASGASGACEGNILRWNKQPGIEMKLAIASASLYERLSQELPLDIEYERRGCVLVAENPEDLKDVEQRVKQLEGEGIPCQMLSRSELIWLEPNLAKDIAGGAFFPDEAQINPILATFALAQSAKERGAIIQTFTEVTGIELSPGGSVVAVDTTSGRIPTQNVVNAAGVWSGFISKMVGLDIPVIPRKGHVVVTEPVAGVIHHTVMEVSYTQTVKQEREKLAIAMAIEHTRSGNILLGSSREFAGFDRSVNPDAVSGIVGRAVRFFPVLEKIHAIRIYTGLRPYTPDRLPIIAESEVSGFYLATGHGGAGICLAPITGKLISQMITNQETDLLVEFTRRNK